MAIPNPFREFPASTGLLFRARRLFRLHFDPAAAAGDLRLCPAAPSRLRHHLPAALRSAGAEGFFFQGL